MKINFKSQYVTDIHESWIVRETEKAIGIHFTIDTGHYGIGKHDDMIKWFPKSQVSVNREKHADPKTFELIVPGWILKDDPRLAEQYFQEIG